MITWATLARLALQIAHLAAQYATTEQLKAAGADALVADLSRDLHERVQNSLAARRRADVAGGLRVGRFRVEPIA